MDRLVFVFHQPRFFGKTFTSIVTQGIFGGSSIAKYLDNMGEDFGFYVTKGCVLKTLEPIAKAAQEKNSSEIKKAGLSRIIITMFHRVPSKSRRD